MTDKIATEEELFGKYKTEVSIDGKDIDPADEEGASLGWGDEDDDHDDNDNDDEEIDDDDDEGSPDGDDGSDDNDGGDADGGEGDGAGDDEGDDEPPADDAGDDERERGSRKKSARERIAEITAARRNAERTAEVERSEKEALQARLDAVKAGKPDPAETAAAEDEDDKPIEITIDEAKVLKGLEKPDAAKFKYGEFDDGYIAAMHEWGAERAERLRTARAEATAAAEKDRADRKAAKTRNVAIVETFVDKVIKPGLKKHADFETVVVKAAQERKFPLTPETGEMLADFANGADIIYHLAKNLDEAKELAGKTPALQAAHLARLSERLSPSGAGERKQTRTKSKAPKPAGTRPRGGAGPQSPNAATTDFAKFEKMVKSQQKQK